MSAVTGLPLIFGDEIDLVLEHHVAAASVPTGTPDADLDAMVAITENRFPTLHPFVLTWDDDEPKVFVFMSPTPTPKTGELRSLIFDEHTGRVLKEYTPGTGFTSTLLHLHREIFAGLPGELLMGFMAFLFFIALLSGALVYGPFMRRLRFGTIRKNGAIRVRWFDLHNLVGITTLSWAFVVGASGVMNALETPLFGLWEAQTLPALLAAYHGKPLPQHMSSIDAAVKAAKQALPGMKAVSLAFPNAVTGSPRHYFVWMRGNTPVTSQLLTPAIIDAQTGSLTAVT